MNRDRSLPAPANLNLFRAEADALAEFQKLPADIAEARAIAVDSEFIRAHVPEKILDIYCCRQRS